MSQEQGPRLRVLQVFNRYLEYGGEEGSVGRIAELLRRRHDLETYYGSTEEQLERPLGKWRMAGWMLRNPRVLAELRELQEQRRFDLWQVHNVFPAVSVAVYELAAELGVPVVQYLHNYRFGCAAATYFRDGAACTDCRPRHMAPALRHRCWRGSLPASLAMTRALNRFWKRGLHEVIHTYVAISEAQKQAHVAMGLPAERIRVVRHFLEPGPEPASEPPPGGEVLFLGRIVEEKGLELLLEAWRRIDAGGRTLRVVGDGPALGAIRSKAESLGLRDVVFEGFVPRERHAELWARAAIFVAPSVWMEPFGMVVLEAWRQGRPVLATDLGSFPELVRDGANGWLAGAEPEAFAGGLRRALDDASRHAAMGRAGRAELVESFSPARWTERFAKIYEPFEASA